MRLSYAARRKGISEIVATVLTISITIIAGASVWGYANQQAGVSANSYGQNVGNTDNYLNEKFVVADISFSSSSATIWIYDLGLENLQIQQVRLYNVTNSINLLYNYTVSGGVRTDKVYDFLSVGNTKCGRAASSFESPVVSSINAKSSNTVAIKLTIPGTLAGQTCPSYAQTLKHGTYTVTILGVFGNSVSYSQKMA